jgi:G3E family GTPase
MIIVGGFLGAGKTTLLAKAAGRLTADGLKVALITNDQAANLVDTEVLHQAGREVKEVAGACFCCAFNRLLYVCDQLVESYDPDVIIGEPVGSCTDLSATVLQPIKKYCQDRFDLAPYTVLVDPAAFIENLRDERPETESVRYIYRKQLEEADLLVLNKTDALAPERVAEITDLIRKHFPGIPVTTMSAAEDVGVDQWLASVQSGGKSGQHIAHVDYDTYAEGEAALGWLNATVRLTAVGFAADGPVRWQVFGADLLERFRTRLAASLAEIAHLKILIEAQGGKLKMGLTGSGGEPSVEGSTPTSPHAVLVVNARVRTSPEELKAIVERCIQDAAGKIISAQVVEISSFRPGRPNPEHRFDTVV